MRRPWHNIHAKYSFTLMGNYVGCRKMKYRPFKFAQYSETHSASLLCIKRPAACKLQVHSSPGSEYFWFPEGVPAVRARRRDPRTGSLLLRHSSPILETAETSKITVPRFQGHRPCTCHENGIGEMRNAYECNRHVHLYFRVSGKAHMTWTAVPDLSQLAF